MIENSEFFMVLPSNASPDTHPNNTATDFTVSLQNPIKLAAKRSWKVALMDMCYSHERIKDSGIRYRFYGEWRQVYPFKLSITYPDYRISPRELNFGNTESAMINIECVVNKNTNLLGIWSSKVFQLKTTLGKEVMSQYHSYYELFYCYDDVSASSYFPIPDLHQTVTIELSITAYFYINHESNSPLPKHILTRSRHEIVQHMIEAYTWIFHELRLEDNIVKFGLANRVYYIKFYGGLSELLGFSNNDDEFRASDSENTKLSTYPDYKRALSTFQGNAIAMKHYGNHNLHIYSNICENVDIGNSKIPLLKSVSIDTSPATGEHGYMRNIIVAYPTYVAVRTKTISKVHIDIRNSAGQKVAFQNGSTTVITLHFKCS